jgi:hypothetical protein
MADILGTKTNFRSLSIKDLLEARDQYHYHLLNKANVVGTAIGLYLIRKDDPDPRQEKTRGLKDSRNNRPRGERTFENSEVREYSWPCVLALVRKWIDESEFGSATGELHPEQMVPKTLYLPDGRMVPVCVVKVEQSEPHSRRIPEWHWPDRLFGGGMPIIVETQEQEHRATAGCLVSDGHSVYALTSRHVCGTRGEPVFTMAGGERVQIGYASSRHLTRLPFEEVYPEFPGRRTFVNLDVGLIELADLNDWTSQIFGLGRVGPLADLNEINISTRLIDAPVIAIGATTGRLEGRIKALFYRYKSVGGYDYVSDFLIAPYEPGQGDAESAQTNSQTQPGDSGAVWHLVTNQEKTRGDADWREEDDFKGDLRPLALEWGGQVFVERASAKQYAFALATSLTTVCKALDVELVLEHNTGVRPYWGQMGHYSIAAFACESLSATKLKPFVKSNIDRISFTVTSLNPKEIAQRLKEAKKNEDFVPLADVPDITWKNHKSKIKGGRDDRWAGQGRATGPEHPTHYADIDEPRSSDDKTLLQLCLEDPSNISVRAWQQFYDDMGHRAQRERGLLPFRVWQFFSAMEGFARNGEPDKFLCAAGLLSHYVGDACQPLHGSMYSDGYADQKVMVTHRRRETGEEYEEESHVGAGVHSTYETKMIDRKADAIVDGVQHSLKTAAEVLPEIRSGKEAAAAIIALMRRSAKRIPPTDLVDAYVDAGGKSTVAVQDALWEQFGNETIEVMTDGAQVLARIWEGAWTAGNGDAIPNAKLAEIDEDQLMNHYIDENFVRSLDLDHIEAALR